MDLINSKKAKTVIEVINGPIAQLIIAALVGLLFWQSISPTGGEGITREFWTKDIALTLTELSSTTGNIWIEPFSGLIELPSQLNLNFVNEGIVRSASEAPLAEKSFEFPYTLSKSMGIEKTIIPVKKTGEGPIEITKLNGMVYIHYKKDKKNLNLLECGNIQLVNINTILIDPGHGSTDPGYIAGYNPSYKESDITKSISSPIIDGLKDKKTVYSTRSKENPSNRLPKYQIKDLIAKSDLILSLHIGKNTDSTLQFNKKYDFIKAYIYYNSKNKEASSYIACRILNSLSDLNPNLDGVSIMPVIPGKYPSDEPLNEMLNNEKIAVLMEIGNIENDNGIISMNNFNAIGERIKGAILTG